MDTSSVIAINGRTAPTARSLCDIAAAAPLVPAADDDQAPAILAEARAATAISRLRRQLASLSAQRMSADETARERLARELHDSVGAELAASRFALANIETWLPADAPAQCAEALSVAMRSLATAGEALRHTLAGLHAPYLDGGLVGALAEWTGSFSARTGLRTQLNCTADARLARLSVPAALAVFRVAQEALTNAARHAKATSADVQLEAGSRYLTLTVSDDGEGLRQEIIEGDDSHYGIAGMRERCAAFGGTLLASSGSARNGSDGRVHNAGTVVRARFAWRALLGATATTPGGRA